MRMTTAKSCNSAGVGARRTWAGSVAGVPAAPQQEVRVQKNGPKRSLSIVFWTPSESTMTCNHGPLRFFRRRLIYFSPDYPYKIYQGASE